MKTAAGLLIGLLTAFAVVNAFSVRRANIAIAQSYQVNRMFTEQLRQIVRDHAREPDFSFYVTPDYPGNYMGRWFRAVAPTEIVCPFVQILYPQYYNDRMPKYILQRRTSVRVPAE